MFYGINNLGKELSKRQSDITDMSEEVSALQDNVLALWRLNPAIALRNQEQILYQKPSLLQLISNGSRLQIPAMCLYSTHEFRGCVFGYQNQPVK